MDSCPPLYISAAVMAGTLPPPPADPTELLAMFPGGDISGGNFHPVY